MNDGSLLILLFVLAVPVIYLAGLIQRRRDRQKHMQRLKALFGRKTDRQIAPEEWQALSGYFRAHKGERSLDEITVSDLELDRLFARMDYAQSSMGEEYLYYLLRTPALCAKEQVFDEETLRAAAENEKERLAYQTAFAMLGRTGRYSLNDYLSVLDELAIPSDVPHLAILAALVVSLILTAIRPEVGVVALGISLALSLITYHHYKNQSQAAILCLRYLLGLMSTAREIQRLPKGFLVRDQEALRDALGELRPLAFGSEFMMGQGLASGNPADILMDYLRIVLHLDLLKCHQMMRHYRNHRQAVDALITRMGRMDALISVAMFRASLPVWSEPELREENPKVGGASTIIEAQGIYHPCLENAVPNDLTSNGLVLITGSNASGKSTFLKATALTALLAQTVRTVPATMYQAPYFRLYSSMSLRDDLATGESYYIVEIRSIKRIWDAGGEGDVPVLCFVDEVLRGTNTVERIAASSSILESFADRNIACFAATHDLELTKLLALRYANHHFRESMEEGDVRFTYHLEEGPATTRNAIQLLKRIGYDPALTQRAEERARIFTEEGIWRS